MMYATLLFNLDHDGLTWHEQQGAIKVLEYELGARCYSYTSQGVPRLAIDCKTPLDFASVWARLAVVDGVSKLETLPIAAQVVAVDFKIVRNLC